MLIAFTDGPAIRSPIPSSNLALWLRADNLVGANGSAIATWPDQSGHGNDATWTTAAAAFTLDKTITINGLSTVNVVAHGATNLAGTIPQITTGGSGITVFYVARTGAAVGAYGSVISASGVTPTPGIEWSWSLGNHASDGAGYAGPASGVAFGAVTGIAANTVFYASYNYDHGGTGLWTLDGVNSTSIADTSWPSGAFSYNIGWEVGGAGQAAFGGNIGEIIVYSAPLSAPDMATIKNYLKTKWGVA